MNENIFLTPKPDLTPKPEPNGKSSKLSSKNISRRNFLKTLATSLAVGTGIGTGMGLKKKVFSEDANIDGKGERILRRPIIVPEELLNSEKSEIERQDEEIIGKTVERQIKEDGRVSLNSKTKEAIYESWYKIYSPGERNHLGLKKALERMKPWIEEMKAIFKEEGVPEEYVYLAISESHFDVKAVSRKNAVGPYQFTLGTAKDYKLVIKENFDERRDPIKSARACAKHLKNNFKIFNNHWNLALAKYNGSYAREYIENFRQNREERNYEDYLRWREKRINDFLSDSSFSYEVEKGQTLFDVAKKLNKEIEELKKINNLESDKIKAGQALKIPRNTEEIMKYLDDSLENLNYPEKIFAIIDLIKKYKLDSTDEIGVKRLRYFSIEVPRANETTFHYTVKKGDTFFEIANLIKKTKPDLKIGIKDIIKIIKNERKRLHKGGLLAGEEIEINLPLKRNYSLSEIAQKNRIPLEHLEKINPAVISSEKELPDGVKIRLPLRA